MNRIIFTFLLFALSSAAFGQRSYKSYTLFQDGDTIVEEPITVDFLSNRGEIQNKQIRSLTVFIFDSLTFRDGNPDKPEMIGSPLELHFVSRDDSLLIHPYSPEYYALFVAYHTIRSLRYFEQLFPRYLDFQKQLRYADIKIFLGRYANSTPNEYVFTLGSRPSPSVVYHEIGHRAFWLLQDTLRLGPPGDILHMGLLEYFTVSLDNYPVVLQGLVPSFLMRDASQNLRYPDDVISYATFWPLYYQAYKDSFDVAPAYKMLYDVNVRRMASWDSTYKVANVARNVIEAHKSGMIITHPLWEIRSQVGQSDCDQLVSRAMLLIPSLLSKRNIYLAKTVNNTAGYAQWFDLIHALIVIDRELYRGIHHELIKNAFAKSGFDIKGYLRGD